MDYEYQGRLFSETWWILLHREGKWEGFLDGKKNVHKTQDRNMEESFQGSIDKTDKIRRFN